MKTIYYNTVVSVLASILWLLGPIYSHAQICDNLALDFDGDGDVIDLPLTGTTFLPDDNFTIEAWFTITSPSTTCTGNFRRLFSLSGSTPNSRFEIGECNNLLTIYWFNTSGGGPTSPVTLNAISPGCHHIAVVRNADALDIYLDGTQVFSTTGIGILNSTLFRVGTWQGGPTSGADWQGTADEIRLWDIARTPADIIDFKDCSLSTTSGTIPGLVVNWTLDQTAQGVVPNQNNSTIPGLMVTDISGNNNNGTFNTGPNGFTLNGPASNFVCNPCTPVYQVDFSDIPALFPVFLLSICEGDYVNVCVTENGIPITLPSGAMVMWESSEGGAPFTTDQDLLNYPNAANALCFPVQAGIITANNCNISASGHINRKYRAVIQKKMGNQICTYTTLERDLEICCQVTNTQLVYTVQPPTPFNTTLCEGQVVVDVALSSTLPFIIPLSSEISIQWCIDGVHDSQYDNMVSITYAGPAIAPALCFEAKIQNCSCPLYSTTICIPVDPVPMCGPIDGMSPSTLMSDPLGGPNDYLICPGDDALIGMLNPADFKNCNPVWQYHFDTDPPGFPNWQDLGTGNPIQNTNTLPQVSLPNNPASPYLWPPGATCIYYRIECRPFNSPNSGCVPCTSNEVRVCLKQSPSAPVISSTANQICKNNSATLSIPPVPGAILYTWYCNGAVIGSGPTLTSINVMQYACYEVSVFDGCFTVTSPKFCLEVCTIVPIITCPVDNPCACDGLPITLIGCNSFDTCNGTGPLTYAWLANGVPVSGSGPNGCEVIHTPNSTGTTYTLTVCNSLNPNCCSTTTLFVEPCM